MAKILAVDDEPAILEMIESILNKDEQRYKEAHGLVRPKSKSKGKHKSSSSRNGRPNDKNSSRRGKDSSSRQGRDNRNSKNKKGRR